MDDDRDRGPVVIALVSAVLYGFVAGWVAHIIKLEIW